METPALEISFESRVPVIGQILILEALDHLYSVFALAEVDWRDEFAAGTDWQRFVVSSPGKLLRPEHALTVEYARTGSVKEVVSGLGTALLKFFKFLSSYRLQVEKHNVTQAHEKLRIIEKELFPIIDKLKKRGAKKEQIDNLLKHAYHYTEEVLTGLMASQKLELSAIEKLVRPVNACPTCKGTGLVP
jgi:hypothetical protein